MTLTDSLLATFLAGFILWLITKTISYFIKRSRIREAILADINIIIASAKEQGSATKKLIEEQVIEGKKIPFPIFYSVGDFPLYAALQCDLLNYFNKAEIVKVIKLYQVLWETDHSINSLVAVLSKWEEEKLSLSHEQVAHIKKRGERIESYIQAITVKEFRSLADLPEDYRTIKSAETVVEKG